LVESSHGKQIELNLRRKEENGIRAARLLQVPTCTKSHTLTLTTAAADQQWLCAGRKNQGGCKSNTGGAQVGGERYRCQQGCDYDLCKACYEALCQKDRRRDLSVQSSREDVLEPSVYDMARESAKDALREGAEEEKQEEQTSKVDILAPYLVDYTLPLDSLQAELVAKKCTSDFRKRLTDRAEIIQRRLEEEQDQLRKKRAAMQRRGDNVEKDEREFEKYQSHAMFRTQILEQRLARHEMQAIEKFKDLEKQLQDDPRLSAMWQKDPVPAGDARPHGKG